MSRTVRTTVHSGAIGVALALAAATAMIVGIAVDPGSVLARGESLRVRTGEDGGQATEHLKWSLGRRNLEIWTRGEIDFDEGFTAVTGIENGGRFKLRARDGFVYRSVVIEPGEDGALRHSHYRSGMPARWDGEARRWLAALLPEAAEKTGIGAESRARDLLAAGGLDAVLAAIEGLPADRLRLAYYRVVLESGPGEAADLARIARHAGIELESDHDRHRVLTTVVDRGDPDEVVAEAVARAARGLDSDHYRADLLVDLAARGRTGDAFFDAVAAMSSDHYRAAVLERVDDLALSEEACAAVEGIRSDHYRAAVLLSADPLPASPPVLDLIAGIDSDHYRHMVVREVLRGPPAGPRQWNGILEVIAGIDSDHHKAALLVDAIKRLPLAGETLGPLLAAITTLDSDHHMSTVVDELLRRDDLDDDALRDIMALVRDGIGSAHRRGPLVETIAGRLVE